MSKMINAQIISLKTPKTAVVEIKTSKIHPVYKKIIKGTKKFPVHYENIDLKIGDLVEIKEIKPVSKTKHFLVVKKIK